MGSVVVSALASLLVRLRTGMRKPTVSFGGLDVKEVMKFLVIDDGTASSLAVSIVFELSRTSQSNKQVLYEPVPIP